MVTHNWGNLFADLVAAVVADALDDDEYSNAVGFLIDNNVQQLEDKLEWLNTLDNTYWVCAFSVDQHCGICGGNPNGDRDSVTGEEHPICNCGKEKYFNATPPLTQGGQSVECEMNKFDDMMEFLAASDENFGQVIAVDRVFVMFTRAWCVAEIAAAFECGLAQYMKLYSAQSLILHEDELKVMKIEQMQASRPEDVVEILAKIPDKDAFNIRLKSLIFDDILSNWKCLDLPAKLRKVGHIARSYRDTFSTLQSIQIHKEPASRLSARISRLSDSII